MKNHPAWAKGRLLIGPEPKIEWLAGGAGPCCAVANRTDPSLIDLYISGRDSQNRSRIGLARFSLESETITEILKAPVLSLGSRGAFDENGTSYPSVILKDQHLLMFYTGWIKGVHVPWYNDLGSAVSLDGIEFQRISRAPAIPRSDLDYLGIGSSCLLQDDDTWHIWYTRFERWGINSDDHPHYYNIKHATLFNGDRWVTDPEICIDFLDATEYAISKPCVLKIDGRFVMWYSYRGKSYRAGLAKSDDGIHWSRIDHRVGINVSEAGWDSDMLCYPHVFDAGENFYMFYNGNKYGVDGLGFAKISRADLMELIIG
ncbi:hypothetical protein G6703_01690 [Polynucleobacter paneuropaeus]|nr:hypothetical protein G6703_01690 [Polynucleobacter paneuropaeus]